MPTNFLDPAGNGFDLGDLSVLVGIIVAASALTATLVRLRARKVAERVAIVRKAERREMEDRIREAVDHVAAKVQPRNGGKGWEDTAATVKQIASRQGEVLEAVNHLRDRLDDHIDFHNKGE